MTAAPNWRGGMSTPLRTKPNEPLTRQRCAELAAGQGVNTALYSSTDDQIAGALWRMFGGAK